MLQGIQVEIDWDIIAGNDGRDDALGLQIFDANGRDTQVPPTAQNYFEFTTQVCVGGRAYVAECGGG